MFQWSGICDVAIRSRYRIVLIAFWVWALTAIIPIPSAALGDEFEMPATPEAVFEKYCAVCHEAEGLAKTYFSQAPPSEGAARTVLLRDHLGMHSSCPKRFHAGLAEWLQSIAVQSPE